MHLSNETKISPTDSAPEWSMDQIHLFFNIIILADNFQDTERLIRNNKQMILIENMEFVKKFYMREMSSKMNMKNPIHLSVLPSQNPGRTLQGKPTDHDCLYLKSKFEYDNKGSLPNFPKSNKV